MFFAIVTGIIKIGASHQRFSGILGDAAVVGVTVRQRIGIGRNMPGAILEVVEDKLIDIFCRRTGNVLLGRNGKQRHVTEQTGEIEIKDAAKSAGLTDDTSLRTGVATPVDVVLLRDKLVAAEYRLVIVYPVLY